MARNARGLRSWPARGREYASLYATRSGPRTSEEQMTTTAKLDLTEQDLETLMRTVEHLENALDRGTVEMEALHRHRDQPPLTQEVFLTRLTTVGHKVNDALSDARQAQ